MRKWTALCFIVLAVATTSLHARSDKYVEIRSYNL